MRALAHSLRLFWAGLLLGSLAACSNAEPTAAFGSGGARGGSGPASRGGAAGGSTPSQAGSGGAAGSTARWVDEPTRLSETGLYGADGTTLAAGVEGYEPRFELWADGAEKSRYWRLPTGGKIDTTNPDFWQFPVGTQLWKEFRVEGKRIETRLVQRNVAGWKMVAFLWDAAGREATAVPEGRLNALGTQHDVPREADCRTCHLQQPGRVLGFSAFQLAKPAGGKGVDLTELNRRKLLEPAQLNVPTVLPGDATAQLALGVLHVNCGTCHNSHSVLPYRNLELFLSLAQQQVPDTAAYRSAVGMPSGSRPTPDTPALLIAPGHPEASALIYRMSQRGSNAQMPPLGSEVVDSAGIDAVTAWISGLK